MGSREGEAEASTRDEDKVRVQESSILEGKNKGKRISLFRERKKMMATELNFIYAPGLKEHATCRVSPFCSCLKPPQ